MIEPRLRSDKPWPTYEIRRSCWIRVNESLPGLELLVFASDGEHKGIMVRHPLESYGDNWEWRSVDVPFWNDRTQQYDCTTVYVAQYGDPKCWMPLPTPPEATGVQP